MRHPRLLLLPAALLIAACQPQAPAEGPVADATLPAQTTVPADAAPPVMDAADPAMPAGMGAAPATLSATAQLAATQGNSVSGVLHFAPVDGGVRVTGEVRGLAGAGQHGFHVHENGDCSAPDASSAGGHFNPASTAHGRVGQGEHHAGDSDNITANDQGVATVDTLLQGVTLGDASGTDIIGKGVIVHADPDDYTTQPTGNAGGRLACGVIAAAGTPGT